jgi:hypothetical protein
MREQKCKKKKAKQNEETKEKLKKNFLKVFFSLAISGI